MRHLPVRPDFLEKARNSVKTINRFFSRRRQIIELRPETFVVPIVISSPKKPEKELLGTGFFVDLGASIGIMTAKHTFDGRPLKDDEKYAFAFKTDDSIKLLRINKILGSDKYDMAMIPNVDAEGAVTLPMAS